MDITASNLSAEAIHAYFEEKKRHDADERRKHDAAANGYRGAFYPWTAGDGSS